ncbi:MAG: hypothetical protein IIY04_01670 [Oscillospiraceae bacterium]|nr:hypothetical protein [Oscillospiraceae bacterium]
MKKLTALLLAIVMCVALTACGGVDKTAAIDAYNANHLLLVEVAELANANIEIMDVSVTDAVTEISYALGDIQTELESADITQERVDEIEAQMAVYAEELAAYKAVVEETIANGGAAASEYDVLVAFATRLYAHQEEMMAISAEVNEGTLTAEAATDRFIQLANDSSATYEEIADTEWTEENIDAAQTLLDGAYQFVSGAVYYAEAAANNDDSLVAEGTAYLEEYKATMETFVSLMEG